MKYVAMDFETGNAFLVSACSIGLSYYEDDRLIRSETYLIRPPESVGKFHWYNVKIHGIKRKMLQNERTFDQIWELIRSEFEDCVIVCHNAVFDTAVLKECLKFYGLPVPDCRYICTVQVSQKVWPEMVNHKLDTVSGELGIRLNHHEAGSDAYACGEILQRALVKTGCKDAAELAEHLEINLGSMSQAGVRKRDSERRSRRRRSTNNTKASKPKKNRAELQRDRETTPQANGYTKNTD